MHTPLLPLQFLLLTFSAWVNRKQALIIDYLREENRVLKEQLGSRNLRLTDNQRRRLAAKGKALGRQLLSQVATIVTPDTILAWYRCLIAAKWAFKKKGIGRPGLLLEIRKLIVQMATENPSWGYCRIKGALKNLGYQVVKSTIAKTVKEQGIKPAPDRPTSWRTFLRAHADVIVGTDFFTTEVWTLRGLVTFYTLFFIEHGTRIVTMAGPTCCPNELFMANVAMGLIDEVDGFLRGKRFLIIDRDSKFTVHFKELLKGAGIKIILAPFQAPNANAFAERFIRSIKHECLNRIIHFGNRSLCRSLNEYVAHYNTERNHQGVGNKLLSGIRPVGSGRLIVKERLGGFLKFYHRSAA